MYLPNRFDNSNLDESLQLIRQNPLATVISATPQGPFVSHIPLIAEAGPAGLRLVGHLARANPHSNLIINQPAYVIFHGPDAYITPTWYAQNDVPTWNYAVVHIQGTCRRIENAAGIKSCLKKLSDAAEARIGSHWEFWIPDDLANSETLEKSIVGIEIEVSSLKAKFKLNQTRSKADLNGCGEGLRARNTDKEREMAEMMTRAWERAHNHES